MSWIFIYIYFYLDWNFNYSALLEYGREFGHCNVPPEGRYHCVLEGAGENGSDLQYEGSLGQWLQGELTSLRGRATVKTAHARTYFQQLVDEGIYSYSYLAYIHIILYSIYNVTV